jgi:hypothetical protein
VLLASIPILPSEKIPKDGKCKHRSDEISKDGKRKHYNVSGDETQAVLLDNPKD